ncbi:hypothetical protein [Actinokineospora enzanensis]|uniref:hypothetical protein n=1 Tax=Actinokineospora enzanensis TaxID=155975 RepID=UPI00036D4159|nr:hypothetical protein [Actinokineospora enzanensis]
MLRGVLLGAVTAALAVSAHGMAGGGVPDTAVTLALTGLVGWAGTALADSRAGRVSGPLTTMAVLGISQLGLHVLLTYVLGPHEAIHAGHSAPPVDARLMVATHVVATVLSALLLTHAGTALTTTAAAVTGLIRALVPPPRPIPHRPAARPVDVTPGHLLAVVLREVCARRGPPVFS